mmetsp:Transcript_62788/g.141814  ORF Transcript_62788/g.141814 Transcript_62788/m.141814 type:complete len:225 (-) Transcript_62788:1583-2257(-)
MQVDVLEHDLLYKVPASPWDVKEEERLLRKRPNAALQRAACRGLGRRRGDLMSPKGHSPSWHALQAGAQRVQVVRAMGVVGLQDALFVPLIPGADEEQIRVYISLGAGGHDAEGTLQASLEVPWAHLVLVPRIPRTHAPVEAHIGTPVLHRLLDEGQIFGGGGVTLPLNVEVALLAAGAHEVVGRVQLLICGQSLVGKEVVSTHRRKSVETSEASLPRPLLELL